MLRIIYAAVVACAFALVTVPADACPCSAKKAQCEAPREKQQDGKQVKETARKEKSPRKAKKS